MKKYLTLFPYCENVHLIKDVGMIPFVLQKEFGYNSTIACYRNGEYSYLLSEIPGVNLVFIPRIFKNEILDSCLFLLRNFRKHEILQLYHFGRHRLIPACFFKLLKKMTFANSFTYLKLDADDNIINLKLTWQHRLFLKGVDLISVETKKIHSILNKKKIFEQEVSYIPNGFYDYGKKVRMNFTDKENLIITVGRIGTHQKYNETLLEAFKNFALKNDSWRLELIGPIEPEFNIYIENYFKRNPKLISRVVFTGAIIDRVKLVEKYKKAKIFVLSSRFEGFPLVYLEAIKFGCTILTTSISPSFDITDNEKYGSIFPIGNIIELTCLLEDYSLKQDRLNDNCIMVQEYANENFSWKKICSKIDFTINRR